MDCLAAGRGGKRPLPRAILNVFSFMKDRMNPWLLNGEGSHCSAAGTCFSRIMNARDQATTVRVAMQRYGEIFMQQSAILIISTGLVLACALPAGAAETTLQGSWIATKAEQDGNAADDFVGHRLSFLGHRFEIRSKDDKPLYAGTFQVNPSAKPATIDFQQKNGALNGKVWRGIDAVDGDTLMTCDNAPDPQKSRPAAFEAKSGSGYVLITFKRAKP